MPFETSPLSTSESSGPKNQLRNTGNTASPASLDGSPQPPTRGSAPRGIPPHLHSATLDSLGWQRRVEQNGSGNFCRLLLNKHSFPPPWEFGLRPEAQDLTVIIPGCITVS